MKGLLMKRAERWMAKNKQTDINYDIRLYENRTYRVSFQMTVPSDIITKLAGWMLAKQGVNEKVNLSEFEVDKRLHAKVLKGFGKTIDEVEKQVKKDISGFKLVTFIVEKFTYKDIGDQKYLVKMILNGDYVIAE
jgi:hypothetical protein